jgi:lactam utilization protein B
MWLASRYRRSAFPDEFERRLIKESKLHEKIAKAVKPHGALIAGVFFDVDQGAEITRAGSDDTYTLDITILHAADPNFDAAEKAAETAAKAIEKAFKDKLFAPTQTWQHIELRSCEVLSESVLTYQLFKQLKRWRLEHISLGAVPQQPVMPE